MHEHVTEEIAKRHIWRCIMHEEFTRRELAILRALTYQYTVTSIREVPHRQIEVLRTKLHDMYNSTGTQPSA